MTERVRRNAQERVPEKTRFTGEKPSLLLYGRVGLIALLKDLLDLVGIGSLPGIGTIVTLCFTFLIWILITVFDRSSHGTRSNVQMARGLVTIFFSLVEALGFGLNFLPIETAMVFVLYVLARRAWKKAKKEAEKENVPSKSQLRQDRLNAVQQAKEARAQRQISEQQIEEPTQQPGDNGAKAMSSMPPKLMSDMKLPDNAVVPKQEFISGGSVPAFSLKSQTSQNNVLTEQTQKEKTLKEFESGRANVWADRKGFTSMEVSALDEKASAEWDRENTLELLEKREKEVESIQLEISQKKDNWINRLMEFKKIRGLEKQLQMRERMKNLVEEDKKRTDELIAAYDYIIAKDQKLSAIKAEVKVVMEASAQDRLRALEQEETARSVEDISKRHNCFLIHDLIVADWKPSANNRAIDTKKLSLTDQLDIVLGLEPTVPASTLREGNPKDKTFGDGSWGVFLSGGKVLGGEPHDAGTQALGLRERWISKESRSVEAIEDAIISPYKASYNELVVERPEVAGLYIKWTENMPPLAETTSVQNGNGDHRYDPWWKAMKSVAERNVPIFVLTPDNHTRLIHHINFQERTFQVAEGDIHPEDMVNLPGIYKQHLGATEKRTAAMRQINTVRHLLSPNEASDIENGSKLAENDIKENPYRLH